MNENLELMMDILHPLILLIAGIGIIYLLFELMM